MERKYQRRQRGGGLSKDRKIIIGCCCLGIILTFHLYWVASSHRSAPADVVEAKPDELILDESSLGNHAPDPFSHLNRSFPVEYYQILHTSPQAGNPVGFVPWHEAKTLSVGRFQQHCQFPLHRDHKISEAMPIVCIKSNKNMCGDQVLHQPLPPGEVCCREGLNLPCCADVLIHQQRLFSTALRDLGVPYFLSSGTALGVIRDEMGVVPWTADSDYCLPHNFWTSDLMNPPLKSQQSSENQRVANHLANTYGITLYNDPGTAPGLARAMFNAHATELRPYADCAWLKVQGGNRSLEDKPYQTQFFDTYPYVDLYSIFRTKPVQKEALKHHDPDNLPPSLRRRIFMVAAQPCLYEHHHIFPLSVVETAYGMVEPIPREPGLVFKKVYGKQWRHPPPAKEWHGSYQTCMEDHDEKWMLWETGKYEPVPAAAFNTAPTLWHYRDRCIGLDQVAMSILCVDAVDEDSQNATPTPIPDYPKSGLIITGELTRLEKCFERALARVTDG